MGNEANVIRCADIDSSKWYICECEIYWGGSGVSGCNRPYIETAHDIAPGSQVWAWVCFGLDCTDGWTLIFGWGDAQRLVKLFGPYEDADDASSHMW